MSGRKQCAIEKKSLLNSQGRRLTVTLRRCMPGDEEGMIACIRDEYKDTYFKRDFYSPDYIREQAENGHITFLVAETKAGEIAGMMILKEFSPKETMCEIASQIFRKKYRGYGLAMPFFEYGMDILLSRNYSAAYCLPVLFHDTTQRLLYRLGLRATGFVMNVFDMANITHSYKNGKNKKHSQGIQIRAVKKQDAGAVYIPKVHQDFCKKIYDSLMVSYHMASNKGKAKKIPVSDISYVQDEVQSSLAITVSRTGLDLPERIAALHEQYPLRGKQTANVFLNISDKNAVAAYRKLTDMGYFFTGLKPLCSKEEYMVLHHPGGVEFYLNDYVLSEEFKELAEYINRQYKEMLLRKKLSYKTKNRRKKK